MFLGKRGVVTNIYFKLMCDIQVEAISRCLKMMVWHLTRRSQLVLGVSIIHVSRNHKNRKNGPGRVYRMNISGLKKEL